jgi:hypothetical protein
MAASVLQEAPTIGLSGLTTTVTSVALGSNATIGSTIECYLVFGSTIVPTSVVDSASQAYTLATSVTDGGGQLIALYVFQNNQSATQLTVTATWAAATNKKGAWVKEIGGVTIAPLQTQSNHLVNSPGTGAGAISAGTITPTAQPCLLSAVCYEADSVTPATPTANTGIQGTSGWQISGPPNAAVSSSQRLTSTSATAATFTTTDGTGDFISISAVYTEASASGTASIAWVS